MPKTDNPHALRLYNSLQKHVNEQTAERIAHQIPLSKSADIEKKFRWAEGVIASLEEEFDEDTVRKVRMDCACGPEMGKIGRLQKLYQAAADMDDFVAKANAKQQGFVFEHANGVLYLVYPECYCSCVKQVDKPIAKAWCYCTLGYTKRMFEYVLGCEVEVELMESVKTGGKVCRIKVLPS